MQIENRKLTPEDLELYKYVLRLREEATEAVRLMHEKEDYFLWLLRDRYGMHELARWYIDLDAGEIRLRGSH